MELKSPMPTAGLNTLIPTEPSTISLLQGINFLLEGPTGTGKTTALSTLANQPGLEIFVLFTEAGLESFLGAWTDKGLPIPSNVHWHVLRQPSEKNAFDILASSAKQINEYSLESLHKWQDPNRTKHKQFEGMLRALVNFPDDRTGTKFGAVDSWGPDRCLVIDSLSGINPWALGMVVGGKPVKSQQDWGIAQDIIEKTVKQLTDGCNCHFVLTAHVEREVDQVYGGVKLMVSTLGKALAPKIPPMFSDVVLTVRDGKVFTWSTMNPQADLKTRNLPLADHIPPDFGQVFTKWLSRGGRFTKEVKV
jgi:hypothetical protein